MVIAQLLGKIKPKMTIFIPAILITYQCYSISFWKDAKEEKSPTLENQFFPLSLLSISGIPLTAFQVFESLHRARSQKQIAELCQHIDIVYKKLMWGKSPCISIPWKYEFVSEHGRPLIYWEFYDPLRDAVTKKNITLILGGVHPDELTPIHFSFQFAFELYKNPLLYKGSHVIVAPLVNPDGFLNNPPKRTNANGVDLNRNFPTSTWNKFAYKNWFNSKRRDKRKFPGYFANSEQGTRFQADLIEKFNPDKVISIHAPLAFLDLDYEMPKFLKLGNLTEQQKRAKNLALLLSKSAGNYKIRDFGIYPGSLGNYAGNERVIPTITLEMSSSNPKLVDKFWYEFSPGLYKAIKYEFKKNQFAYSSLSNTFIDQ
ncbi:M14 family zinc carboxypeptidase [Spirobacillus cienkowskii]|uniref:M14 family zinc carboxypeptidase n=1 Tax=Spirobacillus cienkowskii TaxID=495820 RepID=UPI0030CC1CBA